MYREAIALGVHRNRPEAEVMLVPEEGLDRDYLAAEQRDLTVFSLREADLLVSELRAVAEPEAGRLYLVDPLGNLMMIYAPGFDPLAQAFGGVMTLTGRPEDPPTFCAPASRACR
jgi:hypothetical protein